MVVIAGCLHHQSTLPNSCCQVFWFQHLCSLCSVRARFVMARVGHQNWDLCALEMTSYMSFFWKRNPKKSKIKSFFLKHPKKQPKNMSFVSLSLPPRKKTPSFPSPAKITSAGEWQTLCQGWCFGPVAVWWCPLFLPVSKGWVAAGMALRVAQGWQGIKMKKTKEMRSSWWGIGAKIKDLKPPLTCGCVVSSHLFQWDILPPKN